MNDYERVADVIRHLERCHFEQPDLETLAARLGLSPHHFHRLFSKWAGITPKDFLQCLTLVHARRLLSEGKSVLDAALDSGLSGAGRLHDLCVNLEAASPGELKAGGAGWTLIHGFASSPFGRCLLAESPRGVCHLSFAASSGAAETETRALQQLWPRARLERDDRAAAKLADRIFERPTGQVPRPGLRAFVRGSAFQVRVWRALLRVQSGSLVSYRALAKAIGSPAAARAVGTAVGRNPLAYLVPCHRVIRETGALGEYRWDTARKRAMLAWETAHRRSLSSSRRAD